MSSSLLQNETKAGWKLKEGGLEYKVLETTFVRGLIAPLAEGSTLFQCVDGYYKIINPKGVLYHIRIGPELITTIKKEPLK